MTARTLRFGKFEYDPQDRRLTRDGVPIEINNRYLDALELLVRENGRLVAKSRFFDEVWRGVPVTDEALTQAIKTLRRQLGDDAASPRFIETVPKHGYRFIAPVEWGGAEDGLKPAAGALDELPADSTSLAADRQVSDTLWLGAAGTAGGGFAGLVGGVLYGLGGLAHPLGPPMGAASTLLVFVCITALIGILGGAGVAFGIALASRRSTRAWRWVGGGAVGGLIVGGLVELIGLDAFNLLLGRAPGDITGGAEGALLGGAIGLGAWIGRADDRLRLTGAASAVAAGAASVLIVVAGGRLLAGSLDRLASGFPSSRLDLSRIGSLLGENEFGPISHTLTAALEGALFGACVAGFMVMARRHRHGPSGGAQASADECSRP